MTQSQHCPERESLTAYLYGECGEAERGLIDDHLRLCAECAAEVGAMSAMRAALAGWSPPDAALGFRIVHEGTLPSRRRRTWWPAPAWTMGAAAAVCVLAIGAAIANVDVRYGDDGLIVRTGWNRGPQPQPAASTAATGGAAPWRAELVALERELRHELAARTAAADAPVRSPERAVKAPAPDARDAELLRRVRTLIEESDRAQQQEMALRLAQFARDMDAQRRADLLRIEQNFGQIEGQTGAAIAQQRQWLNYLVRASQRR